MPWRDAAFVVQVGQRLQIQRRPSLADVHGHREAGRAAMEDADATGAQQPLQALGGDPVDGATGRGGLGDPVQQPDGVGVGLGSRRRPAAHPAADADHHAGGDQQGHGDDLGQRVDDQRVVGRGEEEVIGQGGRDRGYDAGRPAADRGRDHDHQQVEDDDVLQPDGALERFDQQPDEQAGDKGADGPPDACSVEARSPARLGGHGEDRRLDAQLAAASVLLDGTGLSPPRWRSR